MSKSTKTNFILRKTSLTNWAAKKNSFYPKRKLAEDLTSIESKCGSNKNFIKVVVLRNIDE